MQRNGNSNRGPLSGGKRRPIKPAVKTGRSEVKSPVSSTRDLGVISGSEAQEDRWRKGSENEADTGSLNFAGLFTEDFDGENGFIAKNV
jgi:hypothetical protein